MSDANIIPVARNAYVAEIEAFKRKLLGAVAKHGKSPAALEEIEHITRDALPKITAELKTAQVAAFVKPYKELVKALPPAHPHTPPIRDNTDHGTVFPGVLKSVEFIRTRVPFGQAEYDQLTADAQNVAFTVSRVQTLGGIETVRKAIASDIEQGGTLDEFRRELKKDVETSELSDRESESLYRTHVGRAYAAGQIAVYDSPAVRSAFPYMLYSATHDNRVRPDHLALERMGLNGTAVYRADDPFWTVYYPPWDWNCRCQAFPLSVRDAAKYGVREAQEWLKTGRPPLYPEFVSLPQFPLPVGWVPTSRRLSPIG